MLPSRYKRGIKKPGPGDSPNVIKLKGLDITGTWCPVF